MKRQNKGHDNAQAPLCEERERLKEAFLAAVRNLAELQKQQTEALVQHDADFVRFDELMYMAGLAKDNAKYALLDHLSNHRCDALPKEENKDETAD